LGKGFDDDDDDQLEHTLFFLDKSFEYQHIACATVIILGISELVHKMFYYLLITLRLWQSLAI
jgi:hypothetical protein